MQGIAQLSAFLLAATLVIVVPGPATLYVSLLRFEWVSCGTFDGH
jgi:hypothetical protein